MGKSINNILVAVDLRSTDRELILYASILARKFNSQLWIVHMATPIPEVVGNRVGPSYIRDLRAEELRKEHQDVQEIASQLKTESLQAEALLLQGPTVDMLEDEVKKLNIDLLIMGSHKRGFLYEMLMGSTSSVKMIKKLSVPILTIPLPDQI